MSWNKSSVRYCTVYIFVWLPCASVGSVKTGFNWMSIPINILTIYGSRSGILKYIFLANKESNLFLVDFLCCVGGFFFYWRGRRYSQDNPVLSHKCTKVILYYIIRDLCLLYHLCVHNKIFLQMYIVKKNQMILSVAYLAIKRQSLCFQSAIWTV